MFPIWRQGVYVKSKAEQVPRENKRFFLFAGSAASCLLETFCVHLPKQLKSLESLSMFVIDFILW